MLIDFVDLIGKNIEVEISGGSFHKGILIDSGLDIIVLYDGRTNSFLYIPFVHIQRLKEIRIRKKIPLITLLQKNQLKRMQYPFVKY